MENEYSVLLSCELSLNVEPKKTILLEVNSRVWLYKERNFWPKIFITSRNGDRKIIQPIRITISLPQE